MNKPSFEVIAPIFPSTDIKRSVAYYTKEIGFNLGFEWSDNEGEAPNYAILQTEQCEIHLTLASKQHKTICYLFVNNIHGVYETIQKNNANIIRPLEKQPWDMFEFETEDPDGNRIVFGEHDSRVEKD